MNETEILRAQLGVDKKSKAKELDFLNLNTTEMEALFPLPQLEEGYTGLQKGKFRREELMFTEADELRLNTAKDRVIIKFLEFKKKMWEDLFYPQFVIYKPSTETTNYFDETYLGKWLIAFNKQIPFTEIMVRYDKLVEARGNKTGNAKYKKNFEERALEYLMLWWNATPDFIRKEELKRIMNGYYKRQYKLTSEKFSYDGEYSGKIYQAFSFMKYGKRDRFSERRGVRVFPLTENYEDATNGKLIKTMMNYFVWYDREDKKSYLSEAELENRPRYRRGKEDYKDDVKYVDDVLELKKDSGEVVGNMVDVILDDVDKQINQNIYDKSKSIIDYSMKSILDKTDEEISKIETKKELQTEFTDLIGGVVEDVVKTKFIIPNYYLHSNNKDEIPLAYSNIGYDEKEREKKGFYIKEFNELENVNKELDYTENKYVDYNDNIPKIFNKLFDNHSKNLERNNEEMECITNTKLKRILIIIKDNLGLQLDNYTPSIREIEKKKLPKSKVNAYRQHYIAYQEKLYMINPNNIGFYANQSVYGSVIFKVRISIDFKKNTITYKHIPVGYFLPKIHNQRVSMINKILSENTYEDNTGFYKQLPLNSNTKINQLSIDESDDSVDITEYPQYPTFLEMYNDYLNRNAYDDNSQQTIVRNLKRINNLIHSNFDKMMGESQRKKLDYVMRKSDLKLFLRYEGNLITKKELQKLKPKTKVIVEQQGDPELAKEIDELLEDMEKNPEKYN